MAGLVDPFQNALDEFNPKPGTTAVPNQIQTPGTQERTEATPSPALPAPTSAPQAQPQANQDPFAQAFQELNGRPVDSQAPQQAPQSSSPSPGAQPEESSGLQGLLGGIQSGANPPKPGPGPEGSFTNPINSTPVTATDRFKLSFGNDRGKLGYLKQRFEDAQLSATDGLLVKQDGNWHKLDPTGVSQYWKDPWEMTRDIADMGDVALNMSGVIPGAGIGFAASGGNPAGAVVGAGAGGAAAGQARTSLGRYFGTYDSTPTEQMRDIGNEALLSMGGELLTVGMKPATDMFGKAVTRIAKDASEPAKEVLAKVWSTSTGAKETAIKTALDDPGAYRAIFNKVAKEGGGTEGIINSAAQGKIRATEDLLKQSAEALPAKYGELLDNLVQQAGDKKIKVNMGEVLSSAAKSVEDNGFGKIVPTKGGNFSFQPLTPQEIASRAEQGLPVELLDKESVGHINQMVNQLSPFSKLGTLEGKAAAKSLQVLNKSVNRISSDAFEGSISPSAARAVSMISQGARNGTAEQFEKNGLGEAYGEMQSLYTKYANAVNGARGILKSGGSETLANQLVSRAGKKMTAKGDAQLLIELSGDEGQKAYNNILLHDAVQETAKTMPNWSTPIKSGGLILGGIGARHASEMGLIAGAKTAVLAAPIATQFSPRFVGAQIRAASAVGQGTKALANPLIAYGFNTLNFVKSLGVSGMRQLLNDPGTLQKIFAAPINHAAQEQQDVQQLLQQGGAIPGGQQNGQ